MLEVTDLRLDEDKGVICERLSFSLAGPRGVVVGAPSALLLAAVGALAPVRGSLTVEGLAPAEALRTGRASVAAFDAPLPLDGSALDYVATSLALGGGRDATREAATRLDRAGLSPAAARGRFGRMGLGLRRLVVLSAALWPDDATVLLTDPFEGLDDADASFVDAALFGLLGQRRFVAFVGRLHPAAALAQLATGAVVLRGGVVVGEGAALSRAAACGQFRLTVTGDRAAYVEALAAEGVSVVESLPAGGDLVVTVPKDGTRSLFLAATRVDAAILRLEPLAGALS